MNLEELQRMKQRFRIIGNAPELNRAIDVAIQVAPTDLTMLITGESGSGKSTIMNMLLGLYKAQEGNIFIYDGIKSYNITEYGISGAGYLEQEAMFFKEGTIKDNILLGREVKADKFNEITLKTGVDDFVKKFELLVERAMEQEKIDRAL